MMLGSDTRHRAIRRSRSPQIHRVRRRRLGKCPWRFCALKTGPSCFDHVKIPQPPSCESPRRCQRSDSFVTDRTKRAVRCASVSHASAFGGAEVELTVAVDNIPVGSGLIASCRLWHTAARKLTSSVARAVKVTQGRHFE
eukprot:3451652-Rhodomonas_salina.1